MINHSIQGAWEGLMRYAEENGKTYKYYQPVQKIQMPMLIL